MSIIEKLHKNIQYALQKVIKLIAKELIQSYLKCNRRVHAYCSHIFSGSNIMIFSNGKVSCFCGDNVMECIMGDVTHSSVHEVWNGNIYGETREKFRKNTIPFKQCVRCGGFKITARSTDQLKEVNFPHNFNIESTAHCNLRCYICRREQVRKDREGKMTMDPDKMNKILDEIIKHKNNVRCINWFGLGEPFMDKNLSSYIKKVRDNAPDIYNNISTNGLLLNTEFKVREVLELEIDKITFSIDGSNSENYLKYQKGGDFRRVIDNLKNIISLRNKLGLKKPYIYWQYIFFKWNDKNSDVEQAKKLAKEIGVDGLIFQSTFSPVLCVSRRYPPFAKAKLKQLNEETTEFLNA